VERPAPRQASICGGLSPANECVGETIRLEIPAIFSRALSRRKSTAMQALTRSSLGTVTRRSNYLDAPYLKRLRNSKSFIATSGDEPGGDEDFHRKLPASHRSVRRQVMNPAYPRFVRRHACRLAPRYCQTCRTIWAKGRKNRDARVCST